jgi:uncharacterized protein (DUF1800 family)
MTTPDLAVRLLAGTTYQVNPYRKTAVPTHAQRHVMNRLGCGYSRHTWSKVMAAGGASAWVEQQLSWNQVPESTRAKALPSWFPDLADSPARKWERSRAKSKGGWEYARDLANYSMLRRVYSERQLLESMVELWSNHLHVPASTDLAWVQRSSYDQVIRRHALGRFDAMLIEASLHPAMLLFLDNWRSVKGAPNENQGRELLELHTVGRTSGYTEAMVKDSAKILSGYTVDVEGTWSGFYDTDKHSTGPVRVLGFSAANASSDGSQLTRDYLRYLAHHPATARTIATKIALRFVSDTPSAALVTHLASVFRSSGTDIKATLRALVASTEFQASAGKKVRTPVEDLVASCRVLGVSAHQPTTLQSFANTMSYAHHSMLLYQWPRPDGPPDQSTAWSSATRMLTSFKCHWGLSGGYYPKGDVTYRDPASWLPQTQIRLDQYVDHLCRTWLGRPSTVLELTVVVQATGYGPATIVTKDHALARWMFPRLAVALLDSPTHMSR